MIELKYVVLFLGTVLVLCVAGIVGLAATSHAIPDVLQNIAIGDLTALAGILVPGSTSSRRRQDPVE